jgi:phosphoglycolate phosphatase-like HAD superfamily hydrolase
VATLIFDFDGTIADSFEMILEIAHELTGLPKYSDEEVARMRHLPLAVLIKEVRIPIYRLPLLVVRGRQQMHARIHELEPFAGIGEALRELHEKGHRLLVMSSNGEEGVRAFLATNKLDEYFDAIYANVALFNKAASLKKVMKREGVDTPDCYYIGDEVRDILAATKVGIKSIAVSWGFQARESLAANNPTVLVDKPSELPNVFAVPGV